VRGGKHYFAASKTLKRTIRKPAKIKKGVKLSSEDWYKRAAAAMSIRNADIQSPSIVPE
jgi:hypothetical protein